jgi:hypothetical protein
MSADEDPREHPDEQAAGTSGSTRSDLSGSAGDVVQARDVHGGVHFHGPTPTVQRRPRQLPADVGEFVNRLPELDLLDSILGADGNGPPQVGLFVIAGTAGVGKTSLAIHWAHRVHHRFPDGQLCVNLRGYDPGTPLTAETVLDRFLRALDVTPKAIPSDVEARAALYRTLLADRRALILLDNAATVGQVRPLLPGSPGSLVLVTSRNRLSGLGVRDGARRLTLDLLPEPDAVDLLRTLTANYRADEDPDAFAELARLCARLPLALRIAAERAASRPRMPLADLIRDLHDESALWEALSADDEEDADAVRTVFAWSYRALPEPAARLFRLLGLHPGPEFGTPIVATLARLSTVEARHLLDVLVGAHLIEQTGPDRYQFHDLLRAYAIDQVSHQESTKDRQMTNQRILTWYLHTAKTAETRIGALDLHIALEPPDPTLTLPTFDTHATRPYGLTWNRPTCSPQPASQQATLTCVRWPGDCQPCCAPTTCATTCSRTGSPPPASAWKRPPSSATAAAKPNSSTASASPTSPPTNSTRAHRPTSPRSRSAANSATAWARRSPSMPSV